MTNVDETMVATVRRRLAEYPPFSGLSPEDLHRVAHTLRIRYLEKGDVVFRQGDVPGDAVYLVKKGKVAVFRNAEGSNVEPPVLIDVCDEGDLFGVRALLAQRPYGADAQAEEASLLYVIPQEELLRLMASVPSVGLFFAAGFATDSLAPDGGRQKAVAEARKAFRPTGGHDVLQTIAPSRNVLACDRQTSIQAAAAMMNERAVGSIVVVDTAHHPVGIVTDADLRSKVVAVGRSLEDAIESIMSAPVVTVEEGVSEASLITLMLQRRLHHFVVTQDGTFGSAVVGVISEHDIWKTRGHHPTVICAEIRKATRPEELRTLRDQTEDLLRSYLDTETTMQLVARVVGEINDALIRRAIALSTEAMAANGRACPGDFCWLALGSEGRQEQLLRTDQDNAIVWTADALNDVARAPDYFIELGRRVVDILVAAGFSKCPGGVMASEPLWNHSLDEWKSNFQRWISAPDDKATMRSNIAFDFRPVAGSFELAHALKSAVLAQVKEERAFLSFFARAATQSPPPLSFFRNEVVERSGEHRSTFDIKARAMTPLADGARVLAYDLSLDIYGSTAHRWRKIGQAEPALARLADEAAMAYEILMRTRALEGLRNGNSGRYVDIKELNKLERQTLRSTFFVVEDVQRLLTSRFRLDMLR